MVVHKCVRCGNDIKIEKIKEVEAIKCKHCNKEYDLDKKTKRVAFIYLLFVVFFLSFTIVALSQWLNISAYILMLPLIVISFFLNKWVLFLMAKTGKVSYKPIDE